MGQPLPFPSWGKPKAALALPTVEAYEELALTFEFTVQQLLQTHNYNTVGNFIRFYQEFKNSNETNLTHFMQNYQPPITPKHHTCVGLGLTLLKKLTDLDHRFPGLESRMYLVSCEEAVDDNLSYFREDPDPTIVEKEHVLVALKLKIAGRKGLLLLDPGYHVARVVTIMEDELYPHTGWFIQTNEDHCRRDYNYTFSLGRNYVIWQVRERRGDGPEEFSHSAVYVARPFLSPVDVTERRNLVYNFRSLLSRDAKGHLTAGIYFPVTNSSASGKFTIFCEINNVKKRDKLSFSDFKTMPNALENKHKVIVEECNKRLGLQPGELNVILNQLANILSDSYFIDQLLYINTTINIMAQDN